MLRFILALTVTLSLLVSPQLRFPARVSGGGGGGAQMLVSDLSLDGAARMPSSGTDTRYAASAGSAAIAARDVGGSLRLFIQGNKTSGSPVYELEDPVSGWSAASSWASANRLRLVTNWGDISGNCDLTWDSGGTPIDPVPGEVRGALFWDASQSVLFQTYFDDYLASGREDWSICGVTLDNPATPAFTTYGPWRCKVQTNTSTYRYHNRCYFIADDPDGGYLISGTQNSNYSSNTSRGPNLAHITTLPTTASPTGYGNPDFSSDATYLDHPGCGSTSFLRTFQRPHAEADHSNPGGWCVTTASGGAATSWMEIDRFHGGIKIDNGQKRAWFAFMVLTGKTGQDPGSSATGDCTNTGHTWYNNPVGGRDDDHGCTDPLGTTGPTATSRYSAICAYSLDDLEANAADVTSLHSVTPVECVDVETEFGVNITAVLKSDPGSAGCCARDPVNTRTFYSITAGRETNGSCPSGNGGDCLSVIWKWGWPAASRPLPIDTDTPLDRILRAVGLKGDWKTTWTKATLHFDVNRSPLPWAAGLLVLLTPYGRLGRRRTS